MADVQSLGNRIDAQLRSVQEKVQKARAEHDESLKQRMARLEQLNKVFDELREVWKPKLELLIQKFEDRVQAKPRIVPSTREVTLTFQSHKARVALSLSASTDRDIRQVVLGYDVEIVPVLFRYNAHDELAFPLDAVDRQAADKWLDDRILEFVETYLSMGENDLYVKE